MTSSTVSIPVSILDSMARQLDSFQRKEIKARYQVVLLLENEGERNESHHWTHYKNAAHSMARSLRDRHPEASRVVVYDHYPTAEEF